MKVGSYEVRGELGRGGNAVVYRSLTADGREVAVKVLKRTASGEALARFARERRLASQLGDAGGFVPILESGESEHGPFLVMPFLEGGTLRRRFEAGPLPVADAVLLVGTLALALARAHRLGIVHRDLKPENVLFDRAGQPLVADLGLGKHVRADTPGASQSIALTRDGQFSGTAGYMAPEQIAGARDAGPPADVFALGAILYEAIAGRPAFEAPTMLELLARASEGRFPPLEKARPDAPAWIGAVVARALDPDPARRYPDAASFAEALGTEGAGAARPRKGARAAVAAAVLGLAALVGVALVGGPGRAGGESAAAARPLETWDQAVAALAAGEADPARLGLARALLEDATKRTAPHADLVLHAAARALEAAPGSPELRRAHARARARLEGDAAVLDADLAALAAPADLPELEALARQAVACGTSGTRAFATARELARSHPSSRPVSGLVAIAAFLSRDPGARGEGVAALESARPTGGHLKTLRDLVPVVDRAAALLAAAQTAAPTDLEVAGRALKVKVVELEADPVLLGTATVALAPLVDGARATARAIKVGFSGARERREVLDALAHGLLECRAAADLRLRAALELMRRDDVEVEQEVVAARERRLALAEKVAPLDRVPALGLVETANVRLKPWVHTPEHHAFVAGAIGLLEKTADGAEEVAASLPYEDLDGRWACAIAKSCLSRATNHARMLAEDDPNDPERRPLLERALRLDRRALALATTNAQLGIDVAATAEDVVEDQILLETSEGPADATRWLDPSSSLLYEVHRRWNHDAEGAARDLQRLRGTAAVRDRPLIEPMLALCEADLGHFEKARAWIAKVSKADGIWGPFRPAAVRAYIDEAERRAQAK